MLVVLSFRPEFRPPSFAEGRSIDLTLSRLPLDLASSMIRLVAGERELSPEIVHQLADKSDGVPLYVEESTKMVLESGLLAERHGRYQLASTSNDLAIPSTLQESLMARLDRL